MSCGEIQHALRHGRALTAEQSAHAEDCDACLNVWLDATVTRALDAKPEVEIPSDFAARVASNLPAKRTPSNIRSRANHWGLTTAVLLVAAGMIAMTATHPVAMNTWTGVVFLSLVVTEVAGIALWLGQRGR
jgi:hypothetical protein